MADWKSRPTARRWLRFEIPGRRGNNPASTGKSAGTVMTMRTNAVQRNGIARGHTHPTIKMR